MIEPDFLAYLLGAGSPPSDIAARVEDRLYPEILPEKPTLPAITYSRIVTRHPELLDGTADLSFAYFQVSCWASTAKEASELAALVRVRFTGRGGLNFQNAGIEDERSSYEPDTLLYRQDIDLQIAYAESIPDVAGSPA